MSKGKSSISKARSYEEIGHFWDTHDLSDFWDQTQETAFGIDLDSQRTYYAVDKQLSEKVQSLAKKRGVIR